MSEGQRMAVELARVLKRTGKYNVCEIARRTGRPRATVCRVLNGRQHVSVYLVEELSLAAGVDLAFLYPERPSTPVDGLRLLNT